MLITASELYAHRHDPSWVAFDCRHDLADHTHGARAYAAGHIPGAHFAAIETDLSGAKTGVNGRHPLPAPAAFAEFLARAGVTPESTIVAYDDAGGAYAARLWWLARWIGHARVGVLDGGLAAWLGEKRPIAAEVPPVRASAAPYPKRADAMPVVSVDDVQAGLPAGRPLLLDARAGGRFRGETEPIDRAAGHVPGAKNRFYKTNLQADLRFRAPAELRAEFLALLGGRAPQELAHYCGSGVTACVNLFAMELAGLAGSQLYAGSWSEWSADPRRPVATGPE